MAERTPNETDDEAVDSAFDRAADRASGRASGRAVDQTLDGAFGRFSDLSHDSREVKPGSIFACVVGDRYDGHSFARQAVAAGAVALLVERELTADELGLEPDRAGRIEQFVVADVRSSMGYFAAQVHGHPSTQMRTIGVTGTNGKTTTTHILADVLNALDVQTAQIGTLYGERTTPESPDLQRMLRDYADRGDAAVVMEVSSHALAMHRVDGIVFDLAIFTNLGHDHLDLHRDIESYFAAKASLFTPRLAERGLSNLDDVFGRRLMDEANVPMTGYSIDMVSDVDVRIDSCSFTWRGHRTRLGFGGAFNLSNALAAIEAARLLGYDDAQVAAALQSATPVPGRFEPVRVAREHPFTVIVDYAHTPDGLTSVVRAARELGQGANLTVVFGCGGDRDPEKRPLMGAAAARGADTVVLTSDNPRSEDPNVIIDEIRAGIGETAARVVVEPDRRAAIEWALGAALPGDVVVIAGKGHERTQTTADGEQAFSDRDVARILLEETR